MRMSVRILGLACAVVLLPSCGFRLPGGEGNDTQEVASAGAPVPAQLPDAGSVTPWSRPTRGSDYESAQCWFAMPAGHAVECGYVTVPQQASQPNGPKLKIAVATVYSTQASAALEPVVFIDGGPGDPSIRKILEPTDLFEPLLANRDLVLIDQRGVGFSQPTLECPGVDRVGTFDAALLTTATRACRDALSAQGVDLSAFSIENAAADIEAARVALGYPRWNLYAISYGTRVSLNVARDWAAGVRSLALDGIVPPQIDFVADTVAAAQQSFERVFDSCAKQIACAARFGNVAQKLRDLVTRLNNSPQTLAGTPAPLTGRELIRSLRGLLYRPNTIAQLPALIEQLSLGDMSWFTQAASSTPVGGATAWGVYFSNICSTELPFTSRAQVAATLGTVDPLYAQVADTELFDLCPIWNVRAAPAIENLPITSAIPSLLTSGSFDPITPPAFGSLVAAGLSTHFEMTLSNESHGSTLSACGTKLLNAFLDSPNRSPDSSCIAAQSLPAFATAGSAERFESFGAQLSFSTAVDRKQLPSPATGLSRFRALPQR